MLSIPPATTTSASPARIAWYAIATVLRPEPHTLLTVTAPTEDGNPARIAAWRAGAWPTPAGSTHPINTSSTAAPSIFARRNASAMATAPSWGAVRELRAPPKLPIGVRAALTITTSRLIQPPGRVPPPVGSSLTCRGAAAHLGGTLRRGGWAYHGARCPSNR